MTTSSDIPASGVFKEQDRPGQPCITPDAHDERFFMGQEQARFLELDLLGAGWNLWEKAPPPEKQTFRSGIFSHHCLMHIERGEIHLHVDEFGTAIGKDEFILFKPGQKRTFDYIVPGTRENWLSLGGGFMSAHESKLPGKPLRIERSDDIPLRFRSLIDKVFCLDCHVSEHAYTTFQLVASLAYSCQRREQPPLSPRDPLDITIGRIMANPQDHWDLKSLAREQKMSYTSFRTRFTRRTGLPPATFIRRIRMSLACSMLRKGLSVKETCYGVGMQDPYHFSRVFKSVVGCAPSRF